MFFSPDTIKDFIEQMRGELKNISEKMETVKMATDENQSMFSKILISSKFISPVRKQLYLVLKWFHKIM